MTELQTVLLFAFFACGAGASAGQHKLESEKIHINQSMQAIPSSEVNSTDCNFDAKFNDCVVNLRDGRKLGIYANIVISIYYENDGINKKEEFKKYVTYYKKRGYKCNIKSKSCIDFVNFVEFRYNYDYNGVRVNGLFKVDDN